MKDKRVVIVSSVALVIILALVGIGVYSYKQQNKQTEQLKKQFVLDKQDLANQYKDLSDQYEGFKMNIKDDNLLAQIDKQQAKVKQLQNELKHVKASDATKITALKRELETLRKILRSYVLQIDSLNTANKHLTAENMQINEKYRKASQNITELSSKSQQLEKTVDLASTLTASGINVSGLNKRNRATNSIKKMDKIAVSFTLDKNLTAKTGIKNIYVRIQNPDDEVLIKSRSNTFDFENRMIPYSMKRTVEYGGEAYPVSLYWAVEEFLSPGTYRVDIFADKKLIGSRSFSLTK